MVLFKAFREVLSLMKFKMQLNTDRSEDNLKKTPLHYIILKPIYTLQFNAASTKIYLF